MQDSIGPIASSLEALTEQYRAITQNLANANTAGYKRRVTAFQQSLAGRMSPAGPEAALEARVADRGAVDFAQGSLARTDSPLDLALDGGGFFVLETPSGPVYTRNGSFTVNANGQLVDKAGRMVAGEGGPVVVPPGVSAQKVSVDRDGQLSADGKALGKLRVVRFQDASALTPVGNGGYVAPRGASAAPATVGVHQGYQESSNVNVVEELVGLITVTRLYEANARNIRAQDERMKTLLGAVK